MITTTGPAACGPCAFPWRTPAAQCFSSTHLGRVRQLIVGHIATTLEPLYPVPPRGDASDNELPDPPEVG